MYCIKWQASESLQWHSLCLITQKPEGLKLFTGNLPLQWSWNQFSLSLIEAAQETVQSYSLTKGYIIIFCHSIFHCCFIFCLQGPAVTMMHSVISVALNLFPLQCMSSAFNQTDSSIPDISHGCSWPRLAQALKCFPFGAQASISIQWFDWILIETKRPLIPSRKTKHNTGKADNATNNLQVHLSLLRLRWMSSCTIA